MIISVVILATIGTIYCLKNDIMSRMILTFLEQVFQFLDFAVVKYS